MRRASWSQGRSTVPGLASTVASRRPSRSKAARAAAVMDASSSAARREGVPPPKYSVSRAGRSRAPPQAAMAPCRRASVAGLRSWSRVVTKEQ